VSRHRASRFIGLRTKLKHSSHLPLAVRAGDWERPIETAFGDDQVINEYMKTTSNQFVDIYEKLFNLFFDTGVIPESWLLGTIKPFYKVFEEIKKFFKFNIGLFSRLSSI
jgi:hypothetical protein